MSYSKQITALVFMGFALLSSFGNAKSFDSRRDYHSYANAHEVRSTHLDLDLHIDFKLNVIKGSVIHSLERINTNVQTLILDTRDLDIQAVEAFYDGRWHASNFKLMEPHAALGQALHIVLAAKSSKVKVSYQTSPTAMGLQWLNAQQTAGKKHPYLYTQAQAIHARSFIPLQDSPQVRTTYHARIHTPKSLRAVMAAEVLLSEPELGRYEFSMPQAIPSYLIAFAIGDIEFKAMGKRTGIYAEHAYLDAAVTEFSDTEKMLEATEKAFGPYAWGRYDLLVLPPSFPFGGMENPRLSFITPTVLAGDKSLVGLIAHELAHSWTGNSVTNATWNDLWLNEGFTTYLTYRIMELVYGENRVAMERVLGYQSLTEALVSVEPKNQRLAVDLRGQDPDDSFSDIPYEKGALFLRDIELRIGREEFDRFLVTYIQDYKFKSLTTDQFLVYLEENLVKKYPDSLSMKHINDWVHKSGIPKSAPEPTSEVFNRIAKHSDRWLGGSMSLGELSSETWTVHEWLFFLNGLPEKLSLSKIHELDKTFSLTDSYNNEIVHSWLKISIRNNYRHAFVRLEEYLLSIGRRKLIVPLYVELLKTEAGRKVAERIYREARPGYHGLAQGTLDAAFKE